MRDTQLRGCGLDIDSLPSPNAGNAGVLLAELLRDTTDTDKAWSEALLSGALVAGAELALRLTPRTIEHVTPSA